MGVLIKHQKFWTETFQMNKHFQYFIDNSFGIGFIVDKGIEHNGPVVKKHFFDFFLHLTFFHVYFRMYLW